MDYESIINEIKAALTGNWEADIRYLQTQMEKYRDHELGAEITRALGRMVYEVLPEEKKAEIADAMRQDTQRVQAALDEAEDCVLRGDIPQALEIMESLVGTVKAFGLQTEDKVSIYLDIAEPFEEVLYRERFDPQKELRPAALRAGEIYYRYGSALIDTGELGKALEALKTACSWNPMSADYRFEYLEALKASGRLEEFFSGTREFIGNCFRPAAFARAYRNLAFYYAEQKRWRDAAVCLEISAEYDPDSEGLAQERDFIRNSGGEAVFDGIDFSCKMLFCNAEKLPRYPDEDIWDLAVGIGDYYYDSGETGTAEYFYTIAAELFPGRPGTAAERLQEIRAARGL